MVHIRLIDHDKGMHLVDLELELKPNRSLLKLRLLLDKHTFWTRGDHHHQLQQKQREVKW